MDIILRKFRHVSWIAIICSLIGSFLMFILGAVKTYYAFSAIFFNNPPNIVFPHLKTPDAAATYLVKSLDAFLIAFVLFIFAHGVYALFISKEKSETHSGVLGWIHIPSISYLKNILAEVIIIILFVKFLESALVNLDKLSWEIVILPASILLLSVSLKLLDLQHQIKNGESDKK